MSLKTEERTRSLVHSRLLVAPSLLLNPSPAKSPLTSRSTTTTAQQARPVTCALLEACDSHGRPSSHSQFMFFFATYFSLMSSRKARVSRGDERNFVFELINWTMAVFTMYSRVYLGYHSVVQVFAGVIAGIVIGAAWFCVVYGRLVNYFSVRVR